LRSLLLSTPLLGLPRPSQRSCTRGSAGNCGLTAAVSNWTSQTYVSSGMVASGQLPATPASLTTPRSLPCGDWPVSSRSQVCAGRELRSFPDSVDNTFIRTVPCLVKVVFNGSACAGTFCILPLLTYSYSFCHSIAVLYFCCHFRFMSLNHFLLTHHGNLACSDIHLLTSAFCC
jgi:hypothetical protein